VVGRRPAGTRFPAGVYLQLSEGETEKCRRFLGLAQTASFNDRARKSRRIRCQLPVTFTAPALPEPCTSLNLSANGILLSCPGDFLAGQRVSIDLHIDASLRVCAQAEICWTNKAAGLVGLRFVDMPPSDRAHLDKLLDRFFRSERQSQAAAPRTVVVADDEPEILKLLTTVLMKHGYRTFQAVNGSEALSLIRELLPRVVVMDILMPQIDGVDICKTMRADAEMLDIPVIFVSALNEHELHKVADDAGATDYLQKPVILSELINLVGRYLK
jgi:CheY-like chemotaxis protein